MSKVDWLSDKNCHSEKSGVRPVKKMHDYSSSEQLINLLQHATKDELLTLTRVLEMPAVMAHAASARQIVEELEEASPGPAAHPGWSEISLRLLLHISVCRHGVGSSR